MSLTRVVLPAVLGACAVLAAWSGSGRVRGEPTGAAAASAAAPASAGVPFVASWVGRGERPGRADLTARIDLQAALPEPVVVAVQLPPGVRLLRGAPTFQIAAGSGGAAVEREYAFQVEPGASGEIVLAADLAGQGYGIHARAAYPVGSGALRARALAAPRAVGPELKLNGVGFGPSDRLEAR